MNELSGYRRILLLTGESLGVFTSKTAAVVLRYRGEDVVGVVDSAHAGQPLSQIIPFAPERPIFASVGAALQTAPDTLFIGIHPAGGVLPDNLRADILAAIDAGLDIVSGMHTFLADDPQFSAAAQRSGAKLLDLRRPPGDQRVAAARAKSTQCRRVLTVGSDCNVGKMVTALELTAAARRRSLSAEFIATGQTGMMVSGRGVAVDAIVSDFAAGEIENLVLAADGADLCVIEGQGAIGHPGFSGVTLSILHGACPDAMILVHHAGRTHHRTKTSTPLPPLRQQWEAYERAAALLHPAKIAGVALNTHNCDPVHAQAERDAIAADFGVPVADVFKDGCEELLNAVLP